MNNLWIYFCCCIWTLLLYHTAVAQVCNPQCQNGGSCGNTNCAMGTPICCFCNGFIGNACNIPVQANCDSNPCLYGGSCVVDSTTADMKGYRCVCAGGYSGAICEFNTQCTSPNDCNGATCRNGMCDCAGTDYYGMFCEIRKAIVGFSGTSTSFREGQGPVNVIITRGFDTAMQTDVTISVRTAASQPVANQATEGVDFRLVETTEMFRPGDSQRAVDFELINDNIAEADEYFELELQIAPSSVGRARVNATKRIALIKIEAGDGTTGCNAPGTSRPMCLNGGTCNADGSCLCTAAYTGPSCETMLTIVNPCDSNPCANNGVCSQTGTTQFSCNCTGTGYQGALCNIVIATNPCGSNPCANNGVCTSTADGQFTCNCAGTGFEGSDCSTAVGGGGGGNNNDPPPPGGLGTAATIAIAVSAVVVVLVIAIAIGVICHMKRAQRNKDHLSSLKHGGGQEADNAYAQRVQYKNPQKGQKGKGHRRQSTVYDNSERKIGTEFPKQRLTLHEHLGSGAFANVVRADAMGIVKKRANTIVAVKMLKEMATDTDRADFMKELKVYRMLEPHPNIIVMLGCCTDKEPYYLIMEYAPHGNLQSHLRGIRNAPESPYNNVDGNRRDFLTPTEALQFASQIANGMRYLASKQCIHRDLATRNVLLGDGLVCKLSDFGLSRDISEGNSYEMQSRGRVPVRWMAPECLLENTYTTKSDVWSFAVTMWEIVTVGSHPYPGMSSKKVIEDLQKGYRLPKPEHCSDEIYAMMKQCWQERPEKRPNFDQIHRQLEQMMEDAQGYLAMTDFNAASYVYLDPDQASDSSAENTEHDGTAGVV